MNEGTKFDVVLDEILEDLNPLLEDIRAAENKRQSDFESNEAQRQTNEIERQDNEANRTSTFEENEAARQSVFENNEANRNGLADKVEGLESFVIHEETENLVDLNALEVGAIVNGNLSATHYPNHRSTDFIEINPNETLYFKGFYDHPSLDYDYPANMSNLCSYFAFYDSDKNYLKGGMYTDTTGMIDGMTLVPPTDVTGIKYVRISLSMQYPVLKIAVYTTPIEDVIAVIGEENIYNYGEKINLEKSLKEDVSVSETSLPSVWGDMIRHSGSQGGNFGKTPLIVETASYFWMRGTDHGLTTINAEDVCDEFTINATSGSNIVSVTGSTKTTQTMWGAVIEDDEGNCKPYIVTAVSTNTFTVYPALEKTFTGKLAPLYADAQHLTPLGYKAYAQYVYNCNPKYCDKVIALERYAPTSKENGFNLLEGTVAYDYDTLARGDYSTWSVLQNVNSSFFNPLRDYTNEGEYGLYREFMLDGREGFLETFIGTVKNTSFNSTKFDKDADYPMYIQFELDGEITEIVKTTNFVEKFCFDIPSGSKKCKLKVFYKTIRNGVDTISIGDTTVWINTRKWNKNDKLLPSVASVVQMFDSWGAFWDNNNIIEENGQSYPQGASGKYFKEFMEADSGITVNYLNRSIGGMTSRYGKQWFNKTVLDKHPSYVLFDYNINDENSATGSDLDGNYGLLPHPYDDTKTIAQNGMTVEEFTSNMISLFKQATVNNITPIWVEGFIATPQSWFTKFLSDYENYWNGKDGDTDG